jgi:hypothetical protein
MRIIRLTESDLTRIVKTVIKEQELMPYAYQYTRDRQANQTEKAKENINPKNLKVGSGGRSYPSQVADVKKLQQKLMDLGLLNINSPSGYFGDKTKQALDSYNKTGATGAVAGNSPTTSDSPFKNREEGNAFRKWLNDNYPTVARSFKLDPVGSHTNDYIKNAFNTKIPKGSGTWGQLYLRQTGGKVSGTSGDKVTSTNMGFIIIFAFPLYKPGLDKGDPISDFYAKMAKAVSGVEPTKAPAFGHGGCVIIDSSGNSILYEFGRYDGAKKGFGKVLSTNLGKIAKIQNGQLINAEEVASKAKTKTHGDGPKSAMEAVVLNLPNPSEAISYANVKEREYDFTDMSTSDEDANCGTFALQVGKAGGAAGKFGVPLPPACVPIPRALITTLRPLSLEFIQV